MKIFPATRYLAGLWWLALVATTSQAQAPSLPICAGYLPRSYTTDGKRTERFKEPLEIIEAFGITPWYIDGDREQNLNEVADKMASCANSHRAPLIVHGLQYDACISNTNTTLPVDETIAQYKGFIAKLDRFKEKTMLYVVEPGALSLIAKGGCGIQYKQPLVEGLKILRTHSNADIYLDVQYSTLTVEAERKAAIDVIKSIATTQGIRIKGFALNTADYKSNEVMILACKDLLKQLGDPYQSNLKCVIDTSRNYQPAKGEYQCNMDGAGIGEPPRVVDNGPITYYLWNKPPGESDGNCMDPKTNQLMANSMKGPPAGDFFDAQFQKIWDEGFFVKGNKHHYPTAIELWKSLRGGAEPPSNLFPSAPGRVKPAEAANNTETKED